MSCENPNQELVERISKELAFQYCYGVIQESASNRGENTNKMRYDHIRQASMRADKMFQLFSEIAFELVSKEANPKKTWATASYLDSGILDKPKIVVDTSVG